MSRGTVDVRAERAQLPKKWTKLNFQCSTELTIHFCQIRSKQIKTPRLFRDNGALENIGQGMVRLRCIVEIEGLLTLVTQGIQQANRGVAQVGTGKGPKRGFDLLSCVCVHGCICAFSSIFILRLFLHRLQ